MTDSEVDEAMDAGGSSRRAAHWNQAYDTSGHQGVSWFQTVAQPSLDLITARVPDVQQPIIDVGGGSSHLVDALLEAGYAAVTVLDVSAGALAETRARLAALADRARWIDTDLLAWQPFQTYALWHDRAVFHFLAERAERDRYRDLVATAVAPQGHLVVGTFAEDGPDTCSGLPVQRYNAADLAAEFATSFELVDSLRAEHVTPWGSVQPFTWVVLRRSP